MNSPIKKFEIDGLFGDRNVSLTFPVNVAIIVDPNGSGKTTFMRALVCILKRKWFQLNEINFHEARVTFHDGSILQVVRDEIISKAETGSPVHLLRSKFSQKQILSFRNLIAHEHPRHPKVMAVAREIGMPFGQLQEFLMHSFHQRKLFDEKEIENPFESEETHLAKSFPLETVYFPTYRRVERAMIDEEGEDAWDDMSIHFGMQDVRERIDRMTEQIRESFFQSYSRTNGQMLTQLIDGIHVEAEDIEELATSEYIEIVLDRIGDNMNTEDKRKLLELIRSRQIEHPHFHPLVYFVNNLMSVYRQQREKDDAIKRFANVVSDHYLADKQLVYDESRLTLEMWSKRNGRPVELQHLSSGEKQIVSIFSRLYLTDDESYAIFFDEPELSLSIEWQQQLLADIYESKSCKFLFAATHSPFVYENDLDEFATSLVTEFTDVGDE